MDERNEQDIGSLPGWNRVFTQVLNAISFAQENDIAQVVVRFDLDHGSKNVSITIDGDSADPPPWGVIT